MPAKDYLGRQWTSGRDVMSQQLDNLFDLDDPEDNYELADYGDKGMLPDYESKSRPTKRLRVMGSGTRNNLPPSKPQPGLQRGEFGRNGEPAPIPGNVVMEALQAKWAHLENIGKQPDTE